MNNKQEPDSKHQLLKNIPILAMIAALMMVMMFSIYLANSISTLEYKLAKFEAGYKPLTDESFTQHLNKYFGDKKAEEISHLFKEYELAEKEIPSGKRIYGSVAARFTLAEFSDIECPFCKKYHMTPKTIVDASQGLVNWEWNHLPLPMHNPVAYVEAHAAECAKSIGGNRSFWVYIDQLFLNTKGNGQGAGDLSILAENIGLDKVEFTKCLGDGRHRDIVNADTDKAVKLGINSTPTTYLVDNQNGQIIPLPEGNIDPSSVANLIKQYLASVEKTGGEDESKAN